MSDLEKKLDADQLMSLEMMDTITGGQGCAIACEQSCLWSCSATQRNTTKPTEKPTTPTPKK